VNDMNNSVVETKIRNVVIAFVSVEFGGNRIKGATMVLCLRKKNNLDV
jgi:hypothetical protein